MLVTVFQFHKGTIRTGLSSGLQAGAARFQFHKGTIRTNAATLVTAAKLKFQFHKGTIRTTENGHRQ